MSWLSSVRAALQGIDMVEEVAEALVALTNEPSFGDVDVVLPPDVLDILYDLYHLHGPDAAHFGVLAALHVQHEADKRRRTHDEKRQAVLAMLCNKHDSQCSDEEIARQCGVSSTLVGGVRRTLEDRFGA